MNDRCVWRGHRLTRVHGVWHYEDGTPVPNDPDRACGHCNLPNRADGHDACLGELPGVMNACCGHGAVGEAYVQFPHRAYDQRPNERRLEGLAALRVFEVIR